MTISINTNGLNESLVTETNFHLMSHMHFKDSFERYLEITYGINEKKFKEILTQHLAPEEFI